MALLTMKPFQRTGQFKRKRISLVLLGFFSFLLGIITVRKSFRNLRDFSSGNTPDPQHEFLVRAMANKLRMDQSLIWTVEEEDPNRPFINTFFEPLDILEPDFELIAAWKHAWYRAGWNPRVLSMENLLKHSEYSKIYDAVQSFGYDEYENMCFLRHFAMSTVKGGGWMVDFDAFPISFSPKKYKEAPAKFTSYGQGVPSLIGGTQQEWERIAQLLLEEGLEHHKGDTSKDLYPFSDMLAFFKLVEKKEILVKMETGDFQTLFMGDFKSDEDLNCDWLQKNIRVIHGAHRGMKEMGVLVKYRAVALGDAMQKYHDTCDGPDFYTTAALDLHIETVASEVKNKKLIKTNDSPIRAADVTKRILP